MELLPVGATIEENKLLADHPDCQTSLPMTIEFFTKIGYTPLWIGCFARIDDKLLLVQSRGWSKLVSFVTWAKPLLRLSCRKPT